ncbi:uncharacterized protein C8A04DRAFT_34069 [Dichotomopilus funicola]|uniref:Coiled-coil domain-containing protein 16 n=1 Tax=Dichotomopilus funicola TaxID=1934379 RepID=A0AAN6VAE8_9PEZI|nr:hypothetical protein C8A04DRAFT_34069 [Dichotomopilus funicola]
MADVRALLRQQRAARRIEHPHASYSDSGKLACIVCKESIKTESLWDGHLRSAGHRQRLQALHQNTAKKGSNGYAGFVGQGPEVTGASSHKRKLADSDEEMADLEDDTAPRKRPKPDATTPDEDMGTPPKKDDTKPINKPITPPFNRRTSGTPTAGVEMQMPSRPATPGPGGTPMVTTPRAAPVNRSPLIPDELVAAQQETVRGARPDTEPSGNIPAATTIPATAPVDEDEWAAFEADLLQESKPKPTTAAPGAAGATTAPPRDSDAVISAPVMTAAEIAAKSEEEERARKRALVDIQLEDEKEEATRALENEFEVMEELEARARKLRERREALRAQNSHGGPATALPNGEGQLAVASVVASVVGDADNGKEKSSVASEDGSDEEEEDDEEEDDWDGFRFRA